MTGPVIAGAAGEGPLLLGRWYAEALGLPLVAAVVHPAPHALGSGRVDAEWVADRRRAAEQALEEARKLLTGAADVTYRLVASSSAAHGLHDLAEETHAAAIVVGSGGSTAERLLAGSSCPIAVTPPRSPARPGATGRIGVAYVDTPDGRTALTEAARLAKQTTLPLRLFTVVADGDATTTPYPAGRDAERAFLETARETYERALHAAVASVPDVQADWRIEGGDVLTTLAALDDIDILFCGSRGYGPARRVLLGGVSARLVRRARRPVVVVPRSG